MSPLKQGQLTCFGRVSISETCITRFSKFVYKHNGGSRVSGSLYRYSNGTNEGTKRHFAGLRTWHFLNTGRLERL